LIAFLFGTVFDLLARKKMLESVVFRQLRDEKSGKRLSHTQLGVWA